MKSIVQTVLLLSITLMSCAQKANTKAADKKAEAKKQTVNKDSMNKTENLETITLGAGCFWCVEAVFQQLKGVEKVVSGYSGGHVENPTYEQICEKTTGHAEVCQVTWDTTVLSLDELLEVYWQTHDPTTLNQQGADKGPQYRSVVFYHNEKQKAILEKYKTALNTSGAYDAPVITAIEAFTKFYAAEDYHQNYYNNNTSQGYCYYVIRPKLEKFYKVFKSKAKEQQ